MRLFLALAALALAATLPAWASSPAPDDDPVDAYAAALDALRAGQNRQKIADRLKAAAEKDPKNYGFRAASDLVADLTASAKTAPKPNAEPHLRLAETRVSWDLVRFSRSWEGELGEALKKSPGDPVGLLLARDRSVIAVLIPLLEDRSPTRSAGNTFFADYPTTPQPRVADIALALIEHHSRCRFHEPNSQRLHEHPKVTRDKVIGRIREWWAENKDKSVAAGVRAQLPHVEEYQKVEMAKTLVRLGEAQKTDDKSFGLSVLRGMVKEIREGSERAYAARALAGFGDMSAVDIFYTEWKAPGRKAGDSDDRIAEYLAEFGRRREWELLVAISLRELNHPNETSGGTIHGVVMFAGEVHRQPYVIPILGRVLADTKTAFTRSDGNGKSQPYSYADDACERLQNLTGKDFGYKSDGPPAERQAAIKKAHKWWADEGRAKYTFDYIEKNLIPARKRGK